MQLAVVILTYGRVKLLERCLKSLSEQKEHSFQVNLHILVNGPDPRTESFLKEANVPFESLSAPKPVGEARNILIDKISEPLICFLDDDLTLPPDYFQKAKNFLDAHPDAQMFGGPDQTPKNSSLFQATLGQVMKSYLATGPTNKRHGFRRGEVEEGDEVNLILCNFWAKSEVFSLKKFPKNFKRNEENFLLAFLKNNGIKMYRAPSLYVYHQRKTSLLKLAKTLFLAGTYRTVSICFYPKGARPLFFVHQALLVLLILSFMCTPMIGVSLVLVYLLIITAESARIAASIEQIKALPLAMVLLMVFNFAYPLGQFMGYFRSAVYYLKGQKF